jgi:hypothetical protein
MAGIGWRRSELLTQALLASTEPQVFSLENPMAGSLISEAFSDPISPAVASPMIATRTSPAINISDIDLFESQASLLCGPANAPPIERRAMTAAGLRWFTEQNVHGFPAHKLQEATDGAVEYLTSQVERRREELNQRVEVFEQQQHLEPVTGMPHIWAGDCPELQALARSLSLMEADLEARKTRSPYMTTRDVHKLIIKPATDHLLCRYIELPEWAGGKDQTGLPFAGDADYFVSHSWDTPWEELVAAVEAHQTQHPETIFRYWIDILAVCQHTALRPWTCQHGPTKALREKLLQMDSMTLRIKGIEAGATNAELQSIEQDDHEAEEGDEADRAKSIRAELVELIISKEMNRPGSMISCRGCAKVVDDMHDWETADPENPKGFERVIRHAGKTVLVMEPWRTPRLPTRSWCLYESYTTLNPNAFYEGGKLDVALGSHQQRSMQLALQEEYDSVQSTIAAIDAEQAEATMPADRDQIFSAIRELPGGFTGLDDAIKAALSEWLGDTAVDLLDRTDPDRPRLTEADLDDDETLNGKRSRKLTWCIDRWPFIVELWPCLLIFIFGGLLHEMTIVIGLVAKVNMADSTEARVNIHETQHAVALNTCILAILAIFALMMMAVFNRHQRERQLRRSELFVRWIGPFVGWMDGIWFSVAPFMLAVSLLYDGFSGMLIWLTFMVLFVIPSGMLKSLVTNRSARFELMGKAGWQRLLAGQRSRTARDRSEHSTNGLDLLQAAHDGLQQTMGASDPATWEYAAGLIQALRIAGKEQEALVLAQEISSRAAGSNPGGWTCITRVLFQCCHADGRFNWATRALTPDAHLTNRYSRCFWLRQHASVLAATCAPDEEVLAAVHAAAEVHGIAWNTASNPALTDFATRHREEIREIDHWCESATRKRRHSAACYRALVLLALFCWFGFNFILGIQLGGAGLRDCAVLVGGVSVQLNGCYRVVANRSQVCDTSIATGPQCLPVYEQTDGGYFLYWRQAPPAMIISGKCVIQQDLPRASHWHCEWDGLEQSTQWNRAGVHNGKAYWWRHEPQQHATCDTGAGLSPVDTIPGSKYTIRLTHPCAVGGAGQEPVCVGVAEDSEITAGAHLELVDCSASCESTQWTATTNGTIHLASAEGSGLCFSIAKGRPLLLPCTAATEVWSFRSDGSLGSPWSGDPSEPEQCIIAAACSSGSPLMLSDCAGHGETKFFFTSAVPSPGTSTSDRWLYWSEPSDFPDWWSDKHPRWVFDQDLDPKNGRYAETDEGCDAVTPQDWMDWLQWDNFESTWEEVQYTFADSTTTGHGASQNGTVGRWFIGKQASIGNDPAERDSYIRGPSMTIPAGARAGQLGEYIEDVQAKAWECGRHCKTSRVPVGDVWWANEDIKVEVGGLWVVIRRVAASATSVV